MRTWKLENLKIAVKDSESWLETCRKMGLSVSGGQVRSLKKYAELHNISTKHFLGRAFKKGRFKKKSSEQFSLENLLVENSSCNSSRLKKKLIANGILEDKCVKCGLGNIWQGEPISLQLDHINGISNDNRLENLRILCPNCHSQTDTFGSRNWKVKFITEEKKIVYKCIKCDNTVTRKNVSCRSCYLNCVKIK